MILSLITETILHMMLYPQNHDHLLKQLESMIKQGQGFQ